jgi:hypothetical protein
LAAGDYEVAVGVERRAADVADLHTLTLVGVCITRALRESR